MTEHAGDSRATAALQITYASRDAFLEDYDRELCHGRAAVQVEKPLPRDEKVELRASFPGLRASLRLRGVVIAIDEIEGGPRRLRLELTVGTPAWTKLQKQVEQVRAGDPAVVVPVLRVLLVEDNPHVARLIREGLDAYAHRSDEGVDFAISYAANGKEALDHLAASACDLLLADVYLPVLDGERLFNIVRADARLKRLPIVAFSAGGDDARQRALGSGADCFLDKPVRLAELLRALRRVMKERAAGDAPGSH